MGIINIPREQQQALDALDIHEADDLIETSIRQGNVGSLRSRLWGCGSYINTQLYCFDKALAAYSKAKAAWKREETLQDLRRAGYDLSFAISSAKHRMEEERKDAELFFVEDNILPPHRFTNLLSVAVNYRWRKMIDEPWNYGRITFNHIHNPRPDYSRPTPKRKPSRAQQERDLQQRLYETWDYLKLGALCSVRDYLKNGGDGATIPRTFEATVDSYSHDLNNYSTQFWRDQPGYR